VPKVMAVVISAWQR